MNDIEIKISKNFIDYESSMNFMKNRTKNIYYNSSKELMWFLTHDHIYTQGTSSNKDDIIRENTIKIIKSNRGGKTTYHGPGQRIVYFLINLNNRNKDVRKFINIIEESLIIFLKKYNIESRSFKDRVGIWVTKHNKFSLDKEKKIGAIGLRISKWVTYHGLSFNINPDMKYYNDIHPCGLKNYENTSLSDLGINITQDEFDFNFTNIFLDKLSKVK